MIEALTTLNGTLEAVWRHLERGAKDKTSPGNLPVLATASDRCGPSARIVVLRKVDRASQILTVFTHASSGKVADLNQDERAEMLVWSPAEQLQIRLSVIIKMAPVDERTWSNLGRGARLNYAINPSPGTPIERPEDATEATPDRHQMIQLDAKIQSIETLWIAEDGLKRAVFSEGRSQWIAP